MKSKQQLKNITSTKCQISSNDNVHQKNTFISDSTSISQSKDYIWSKATIIENKAASADGSVRLLILSIEDHVDYLEGRKLKRIQKSPRWLDGFKNPGQYIKVKLKEKTELYAIASSPSSSRTQSALLDASIIEILVEKNNETGLGKTLSDLGPGELIQVSQALGRGFVSLFSTDATLASALEESRPMLLICASATGLAPMRSVLNWVPVMALSTTQSVSLAYLEEDAVSAACIQEWDDWRDNNVKIFPIYKKNVKSNFNKPIDLINRKLFFHHDGLQGVIEAKPYDCCVLLSGLPNAVSMPLTKMLMNEGISQENLLFCQYF